MAKNNFNILSILFFIALTIFYNFNGSHADQDCSVNLADEFKNIKRHSLICNDGRSSEVTVRICYPSVLSDADPIQKRKPSRRFQIPINEPESEAPGVCSSEADLRNYGTEFNDQPHTYLDDYQKLFLKLVAPFGWKECGKMVATTESSTTIATTTAQTTTIPTTTVGPVVFGPVTMVKEVPNSYKFNDALRDGCTIGISGELPDNGIFEVILLRNYPKSIPGLSEEMFKFQLTDGKFKLKRRYAKEKEVDRNDLFDNKTIDLKIKLFDDKYVVFLGDKELANVTNRDPVDPLWAINYTHITGDLKLLGENPIKVECDKKNESAPKASSIDWSNKLDDMKPTELELVDLQFKNSGAELFVYLLLDCPKFDKTVCMVAMEYKLDYLVNMGTLLTLHATVHRRQPSAAEPDGSNRPIGRIGILHYPLSRHWTKFNVTISLGNSREMGLKVQGEGDKWLKKPMEWMTETWQERTHQHAQFVQVLTKGEVGVGDWHLHTAPRPVPSLNGNKTFEPGKTTLPWSIEHKLTNWANGDYIKVHIKFVELSPLIMELYRGYPSWADDHASYNNSDDFGQSILRISVRPSEGNIVSAVSECRWDGLRKRTCEDSGEINSSVVRIRKVPEDEPLFQKDKEYVLHIIYNSSPNYLDSFSVMLYDNNNKEDSLASYEIPSYHASYYAVEYFKLVEETGNGTNIILMEKPCKVGDENC